MAKDPGQRLRGQRRSVLLRPFLLAVLGSTSWMIWLAGPSSAATDILPLPGGTTALTQSSETSLTPSLTPVADTVDSVVSALDPLPEVPAVPAVPTVPAVTTVPTVPSVPALPSVTVPEAPLDVVVPEVQGLLPVEDVPGLLPEVPDILPVPAIPGLPDVPELPGLTAPPLPGPLPDPLPNQSPNQLPTPLDVAPPAVPTLREATTPPTGAPTLPLAVVLQSTQAGAPLLGGISLPLPLSMHDPVGVPLALMPGPVNPVPDPPLHPALTPSAAGSSGARGSSASAPGASDIPEVLSPLPPPRAGPVVDPQRSAAPQPSYDPGSRPD